MLKEGPGRAVKNDSIKEQRDVCHYILAYLSENPEAGDTIEGIVEWWLLIQRIKFAMHTVSVAVASLVAEGLIEEHKGYDSRSVYKIKQTDENRQRISQRLREMRSSLQY